MIRNRLKRLESAFHKRCNEFPVGFLYIDKGVVYRGIPYTEPLSDKQIEDFHEEHEVVYYVEFVSTGVSTKQPDLC